MNTHPAQPDPRRPGLKSVIGWSAAVLLVIGAWALALDLRAPGSTQPVHLDGWTEGLDAGKALAAEQDRPMIVLFTASWCGPCQTLKHEVLSQESVADELSEKFVAVKIDLTDRSSSNPNNAVAIRYGVAGIPAVIAIDADGQVINQFDPRQGNNVGSFMLWLGKAEIEANMQQSAAR